MHTETGKIVEWDDIPPQDIRDFIPVTRDLTPYEKYNKRIAMYSPCGCGSSRKFKFCCYKKPRSEWPNNQRPL